MKKNKKAFTLVELLVVIAILAILATVSIVGYTQFIKKARQSNAVSELTEIRDLVIAEDINNKDFEIVGDYIKFATKKTDATEATEKDLNTLGLISEKNVDVSADLTGEWTIKWVDIDSDDSTYEWVISEITYKYADDAVAKWTVSSGAVAIVD